MPTVTLITGGNGGLGIALATAFLQAAPDNVVWLGVRNRRNKAEALAEEHPKRCHLIPLNVTVDTEWTAAISEILSASGRLDVLVNNAGHHEDALLATMSDAIWQDVLQSNLTGTFLGCRAVVKHMMGQRFGRIINISSLSALMPPQARPTMPPPRQDHRSHPELCQGSGARRHHRECCLPGLHRDRRLVQMSPEERRAAAMRVPMRRLGKPEEVAAAVLFLASPSAAYITGAALKIDGGIL